MSPGNSGNKSGLRPWLSEEQRISELEEISGAILTSVILQMRTLSCRKGEQIDPQPHVIGMGPNSGFLNSQAEVYFIP